jgi:hypothetical protein
MAEVLQTEETAKSFKRIATVVKLHKSALGESLGFDLHDDFRIEAILTNKRDRAKAFSASVRVKPLAASTIRSSARR